LRILVTGGCGFIGTNFCEHAIKTRNWQIIAFDNLSREKVALNLHYLESLPNFRLITGDIRNSCDFRPIPPVDAIVHLAANPGIPRSISQPKFDFDINARGTLNILEFARGHGKIPVLYASTNKVYPDKVNKFARKIGPRYELTGRYINGIDESFPIDGCGKFAHSPYGCSKYVGDLYCQEYFKTFGVPTVVNRMSCIAGEWQRGCEEQGWVQHFVKSALTEKPITIFGNGCQTRDVLYGEDLAELYCREIERIDEVAGSVFNVGGGKKNTISVIECVEYLEKKVDRRITIKKTKWRPADHRVYYSCLKRVAKIWKPKTSVFETLDKLIEWTRNELGKREMPLVIE